MNLLKKARIDAGLTMREVSQELDITENYLYMLESEMRTPSLPVAKKLSDFYNTTVDELFFTEHTNITFGNEETA